MTRKQHKLRDLAHDPAFRADPTRAGYSSCLSVCSSSQTLGPTPRGEPSAPQQLGSYLLFLPKGENEAQTLSR